MNFTYFKKKLTRRLLYICFYRATVYGLQERTRERKRGREKLGYIYATLIVPYVNKTG